ncbi:hypothetical protein WN944_009197 [Citrus x changshan-huyou]|uniref:Uncharacterized protein n=1 Tax=Citrus x changshan-huyou TaxID=2935761 RepID=A0AAP0MU14_9ROSI
MLYRNLLAFEWLHDYTPYFNDYIIIIAILITAPKDAELLFENEIVGHSEELPTIFGNLSKDCTLVFDGFLYSGLLADLYIYRKSPWHKWKATLKQNYFNTPWASISVIAAVILLLLTVTQTVCSLVALEKRKRNEQLIIVPLIREPKKVSRKQKAGKQSRTYHELTKGQDHKEDREGTGTKEVDSLVKLLNSALAINLNQQKFRALIRFTKVLWESSALHIYNIHNNAMIATLQVTQQGLVSPKPQESNCYTKNRGPIHSITGHNNQASKPDFMQSVSRFVAAAGSRQNLTALTTTKDTTIYPQNDMAVDQDRVHGFTLGRMSPVPPLFAVLLSHLPNRACHVGPPFYTY